MEGEYHCIHTSCYYPKTTSLFLLVGHCILNLAPERQDIYLYVLFIPCLVPEMIWPGQVSAGGEFCLCIYDKTAAQRVQNHKRLIVGLLG